MYIKNIHYKEKKLRKWLEMLRCRGGWPPALRHGGAKLTKSPFGVKMRHGLILTLTSFVTIHACIKSLISIIC